MTKRTRIYMNNKNRKYLFLFEGPEMSPEEMKYLSTNLEIFMQGDRKAIYLHLPERVKLRIVQL